MHYNVKFNLNRFVISSLRAADLRESQKLGEQDRLRQLRCLLISMNSKVLHALVPLFHTELLMKIFFAYTSVQFRDKMA